VTSLSKMLKTAALAMLSLLLLGSASTQAAGLLTPSDGSLPALSIRDHRVDVLLQDGYAVTTVEQVFHNPHGRNLEAIYSFPVPEQGTVAEFTVWIDGKPVTGEVLEQGQAEQVYREEKAAGRDAGLTGKDGYRTFDVRISPVRAGQDTRTRFVYLQPVKVDHGIGRYVYPLEEGGVDERKLDFWTANETVTGQFSFSARLRSGYPVAAVRVPNGGARIDKQDAQNWDIRIANGSVSIQEEGAESQPQNQPSASAFTLDQDIVVYWRLEQDLPGAVDMVTNKPDANGRGTFLLTLTPGNDLAPIRQGTDWVFVLDISGSMQGKYATLAEGVKQALGKLRNEDRFRIVTFNKRAQELTPGYVTATPEHASRWADAVGRVRPNGSTNLYAGLELGLDRIEADRSSGILLVTDGVANVGETRQRAFLEMRGKQDVRLFTFIMGNSANRPLLETLTLASNGFARSISNSDDIVGEILTASSKLTHKALHGVKLDIEGIKTADLTPAHPGSLYRGQQLLFLGHYWGEGTAKVVLNGRISGEQRSYATEFDFPAQSSSNPELERLWAYGRIREIQREIDSFGDKPDLRQAIVDLGKEYGLVTDYTSMVVVREEVFAQRGIERRNAKRSETERTARAQRRQQPPQTRRVDQAKPMFSGEQPRLRSGGGSGALSPVEVGFMAIGVVLLVLIRRRKTQSTA